MTKKTSTSTFIKRKNFWKSKLKKWNGHRRLVLLHDDDDGGRHETESLEGLVVIVKRENLLRKVGHQLNGSVPVGVVAMQLDVKSNGRQRLLGAEGLKVGRKKRYLKFFWTGPRRSTALVFPRSLRLLFLSPIKIQRDMAMIGFDRTEQT